ncbi:MAG: sodium-dependent transporter [Hydrogeniiclostridium mannosilyticum]
MPKQNQWTSRLGFLLAAAGAAIGLGNLWKFPYLMGRNGGFPFLIAYLIFIVLLGVPVMMLEMSLGRYSGKDPVSSYKKVHPRAGIAGFTGVLAAFIILSYYSVIGGWILEVHLQLPDHLLRARKFRRLQGQLPETVLWHFLFMAATALICHRGSALLKRPASS